MDGDLTNKFNGGDAVTLLEGTLSGEVVQFIFPANNGGMASYLITNAADGTQAWYREVEVAAAAQQQQGS